MVYKRKGMNEKQKRWLKHYIKCWNAKQAAILAGYSEASAHAQGSRMLNRPEVISELNMLQHLVPKEKTFEYDQFVEHCSQMVRERNRDSTVWAQLLAKVRGWGTETMRLQVEAIPPPVFALPGSEQLAAMKQVAPVQPSDREIAPPEQAADNNPNLLPESSQVTDTEPVERTE